MKIVMAVAAILSFNSLVQADTQAKPVAQEPFSAKSFHAQTWNILCDGGNLRLKWQSRLTNQATGRKYYDLVLTLNRANTSGGHVALLYQDAQAAIRRVGISTVSLIQLVDENEIDGGMSGGCSETELSIQMIGPEVKQIRLESQSLSEPALLDVPAKPID